MRISLNECNAVQRVTTASPAAHRISRGQEAPLALAGGRRLVGEIRVSGAKNAVLPMLCASLLRAEPVHLAPGAARVVEAKLNAVGADVRRIIGSPV